MKTVIKELKSTFEEENGNKRNYKQGSESKGRINCF